MNIFYFPLAHLFAPCVVIIIIIIICPFLSYSPLSSRRFHLGLVLPLLVLQVIIIFAFQVHWNCACEMTTSWSIETDEVAGVGQRRRKGREEKEIYWLGWECLECTADKDFIRETHHFDGVERGSAWDDLVFRTILGARYAQSPSRNGKNLFVGENLSVWGKTFTGMSWQNHSRWRPCRSGDCWWDTCMLMYPPGIQFLMQLRFFPLEFRASRIMSVNLVVGWNSVTSTRCIFSPFVIIYLPAAGLFD